MKEIVDHVAKAIREAGDAIPASVDVTDGVQILARAAIEVILETLKSVEMQAVAQQAIMKHPHYKGGAVSAYGFAGSALKAISTALLPIKEPSK